jgi:ABC-type molybdate transport system substrate-binding protein
MTAEDAPNARPSRLGRRCLLAFPAMLAAGFSAPAFADDGLLIFAAMTLKASLDQVVALYRAGGGTPVTVSYG